MGWDIRRQGHPLEGGFRSEKWQATPEKIEMVKGCAFDEGDGRSAMLGVLLENVGADAVVRMGDPEVWRAAVAGLKGSGDANLPIDVARTAPDVNEILNTLRNTAGGHEDVDRMPENMVRLALRQMIELFATLDTACSTGLAWPSEWVVPHD